MDLEEIQIKIIEISAIPTQNAISDKALTLLSVEPNFEQRSKCKTPQYPQGHILFQRFTEK